MARRNPFHDPGGTALAQVVILTSAIALGVLLGLWLLWRFQERIVFQPPRVVPAGELSHPRPVSYRAADGQPLIAYVVGQNDDPAADASPANVGEVPLVLVFHGNAELAVWLLPWARELSRRTAARVFLAEYRGYAGLPGTPSHSGVQADALAAFTYVQETLGVPARRCVLFGHSLGSAVAAELAIVVRPAALVLQAPFTSARAMGARLLIPSTPGVWRWFSRVHFDTERAVQSLDCPVFVAHGERDVVVPVGMGRQLFNNARSRGALFVCRDAGHNDVPDLGGADYWSWISSAVAVARDGDTLHADGSLR
jgi:uncharacterized protein